MVTETLSNIYAIAWTTSFYLFLFLIFYFGRTVEMWSEPVVLKTRPV